MAADLFARVWADHAGAVHNLARKLAPLDRHLREDLVAAGMVGLWEAWQRYDPAYEGSGGLWGFANFRVRGAMREHLRSLDLLTRHERKACLEKGRELPQRRAVELEGAETEAPHQPTVDRDLTCTQVEETVRECLDLLPEADADLLVRRFFHENSLLDIALEEGVSESRICQRVGRALRRLREAIEDDPRLGFLTRPHKRSTMDLA